MKRCRWRDSMALRNEAAAWSEEKVRAIAASWMSIRSLLQRNALPITPSRTIMGLLMSPLTSVNWPTEEEC